MSNYQHPDFEYTTLTVPFEARVLSAEFDREINETMGYTRVWADITMGGAYIVYRRPRKTAEPKYEGPLHQYRTEAIGYLRLNLSEAEQFRLKNILVRLVDGDVDRLLRLLAYTPGAPPLPNEVLTDVIFSVVTVAVNEGWDGNLVKRAQCMWPKEAAFNEWGQAADKILAKKRP